MSVSPGETLIEKEETEKEPGHHRVKIRETNVLHFPAHQEQRRHITNNAHKEALVSGNLTWEPQTKTMIYATNKESER